MQHGKREIRYRDLKLKIGIGILIGIYWIGVFALVQNQNQNSNFETRIENKELIFYETKTAQESKSVDEILIEKANLIPFFYLSESDKYIATCIVAGEAEGENYEGKLAVAQVILNSMIYEDCGIENVKWKFDGWNPKLESKNPELWAECRRAVDAAFDDGDRVTDEFILWFYNRNAMYSRFHESQKWAIDIGNHSFFAPNW